MHFSQAKFCESGKGFSESGESGNPEGVAPMYKSLWIDLPGFGTGGGGRAGLGPVVLVITEEN